MKNFSNGQSKKGSLKDCGGSKSGSLDCGGGSKTGSIDCGGGSGSVSGSVRNYISKNICFNIYHIFYKNVKKHKIKVSGQKDD